MQTRNNKGSFEEYNNYEAAFNSFKHHYSSFFKENYSRSMPFLLKNLKKMIKSHGKSLSSKIKNKFIFEAKIYGFHILFAKLKKVSKASEIVFFYVSVKKMFKKSLFSKKVDLIYKDSNLRFRYAFLLFSILDRTLVYLDSLYLNLIKAKFNPRNLNSTISRDNFALDDFLTVTINNATTTTTTTTTTTNNNNNNNNNNNDSLKESSFKTILSKKITKRYLKTDIMRRDLYLIAFKYNLKPDGTSFFYEFLKNNDSFLSEGTGIPALDVERFMVFIAKNITRKKEKFLFESFLELSQIRFKTTKKILKSLKFFKSGALDSDNLFPEDFFDDSLCFSLDHLNFMDILGDKNLSHSYSDPLFISMYGFASFPLSKLNSIFVFSNAFFAMDLDQRKAYVPNFIGKGVKIGVNLEELFIKILLYEFKIGFENENLSHEQFSSFYEISEFIVKKYLHDGVFKKFDFNLEEKYQFSRDFMRVCQYLDDLAIIFPESLIVKHLSKYSYFSDILSKRKLFFELRREHK